MPDSRNDYRKLSTDVFDQILTAKLDGMTGAELLTIPGIYEIVRDHLYNDMLDTWENTLEYVQVNLIPTYRDDVGWKADLSGILPSFTDEDDALADLYDTYPTCVLELGVDVLPSYITNIWHDIEGDHKPDRVFACQEDAGGPIVYIGIALRSDTY